MYRTAFSAGRRVYASKLWKTIDLPSQSKYLAASTTLQRYSSSSSQKFSLDQIAAPKDAFTRRHIGPDAMEENEMLRTLNFQVNIDNSTRHVVSRRHAVFMSVAFSFSESLLILGSFCFQNIDELMDKTLPSAIKFSKDLNLDEALSKF